MAFSMPMPGALPRAELFDKLFRERDRPQPTFVSVPHESGTAQEAEEALLDRYVVKDKGKQSATSSISQHQIATSKEDAKVVAIKRISKQDAISATEIRRQITMLWDMPHPIIPSMNEWLDGDSAIFLVVDYTPRNSLRQLVEGSGPVPADGAKDVMMQLLAGMAHLFFHHIAYLRICPDNLMFDNMSNLVIEDFSAAQKYNEGKDGNLYASITGKYASDIYTAPEVFEHEKYNARKAVVWSCGVVLYYLTTGQTDRLASLDHPSFQINGGPSRRRLSLASKVPKEIPKIIPYPNRLKVPRWTIDIVSKMLIFDPFKRPELIEVAAKVPKLASTTRHDIRPLMELAYLDYKYNVGPVGPPLVWGTDSSASSIRSTNTLTSLFSKGYRNRASSSAW